MTRRHRIALARGVYGSHLAMSAVSALVLAFASNSERAWVGYELSNWKLDFTDAVALNLGSGHTALAVRLLLAATLFSVFVSTVLYVVGRDRGRHWLTALGAFVLLAFLVNVPYLLASGLHGAVSTKAQDFAGLVMALSRHASIPLDSLVSPFLVPFTWTPSLSGMRIVFSVMSNVWCGVAAALAGYLALSGIPAVARPRFVPKAPRAAIA